MSNEHSDPRSPNFDTLAQRRRDAEDRYYAANPLDMQYDPKMIDPQPEDIICDVCGRSCRDKHGMNIESGMLYGYWGFYSDRDGQECGCNLCEGCFRKVEEFIVHMGGGIRVRNYPRLCNEDIGNPRGKEGKS